jgi:hypothetical protein
VHEEELDVVDVADEEGLVAGGHHVAGLLVGTIADLDEGESCQPLFLVSQIESPSRSPFPLSSSISRSDLPPDKTQENRSHVPRA